MLRFALPFFNNSGRKHLKLSCRCCFFVAHGIRYMDENYSVKRVLRKNNQKGT